MIKKISFDFEQTFKIIIENAFKDLIPFISEFESIAFLNFYSDTKILEIKINNDYILKKFLDRINEFWQEVFLQTKIELRSIIIDNTKYDFDYFDKIRNLGLNYDDYGTNINLDFNNFESNSEQKSLIFIPYKNIILLNESKLNFSNPDSTIYFTKEDDIQDLKRINVNFRLVSFHSYWWSYTFLFWTWFFPKKYTKLKKANAGYCININNNWQALLVEGYKPLGEKALITQHFIEEQSLKHQKYLNKKKK